MPKTILGFTANDQASAAEGEFNPNGTFVHQVNAADASLAALPGCGPISGTVPRAQYALAAAYLDRSTNQLGNVIQLRFATPRQAQAWLSVFTAQVRQCPRVAMSPVITASTVQDQRRSEGILWSEAGDRNQDTVTLAALEGTHDTARILAALM